MTTPADTELIRAIFDALRGDTELIAIVGDRIFDRVPQKPAPLKPYVALGTTETVPDIIDRVAGEEIALQLDIYSAGDTLAYSSVECRQIRDRVQRLLHDADLVLADNALVTLTVERTRVLREADGITSHGVVQLVAIVETP